MKFRLSLFFVLFAWLPLAADSTLPEPPPFLGLSWGMDQRQVERMLERNDNMLLHGGYLLLDVGGKQVHARRYGTCLIDSVPLELICGFDVDYTSLELILLRYSAGNFNHARAVYDKLITLFSEKLLGADSGRSLRARERRPSRQDIVVDWQFPHTRFHMRVWGSDASGQMTILFSRTSQPQ